MTRPRLPNRIADLAKADAGHAILSLTVADQMLEVLILTHLPKISDDAAVSLFAHPGPLNSLLGKAKFAHALGWIDDDTLKDLKGIQKVRNAFAHPRVFLHFNSPEVATVFERVKHWPSDGVRKPCSTSAWSAAAWR